MSNRNFAHTSNFEFHTNLFTEDVTIYFLQECNLPGLDFGHIQVGKGSIKGYLQADTLNYNSLNISVILDEKLKVWKEIYNILKEMRNPDNDTSKNIERFGYLIIKDDESNEVILKIEFKNIKVTSIGDVQFSNNTEDDEITIPIGMVYDYYIVK